MMERGAGERAQPFPRSSPWPSFGQVCLSLCDPGRQEPNVMRFERYDLSFRQPGLQPLETTTQRTMPVSTLPIAVAGWLFRKSHRQKSKAKSHD